MDKSKMWTVKVKLWVNTKGWWDSGPVKIRCESEEEANRIAEDVKMKIQNAIDSDSKCVIIENLSVRIKKLNAFKIKIKEPKEPEELEE